MSYLKLALQALEEATIERGDYDQTSPANVANLHPIETPQASPPEHILTCAECPWYEVNPWTHYPELPAWCAWHFDHLSADNPACIGYRRGEIPPRENP